MNKSIKKNYTYNLIYQLIVIILPIITTPYLSRVLGAEKIGIYGYVLSITTYFILFGTLGTALYGKREIAYVNKNKKEYSRAFWEIFIVRMFFIIVSLIFFYIFFIRDTKYGIYYGILSIDIIANIFDVSWFYQGLEEFQKIVIRNVVIKALSVIAIFVFVKTRKDLNIYLLIYALSTLFANLSLWIHLPKYLVKVDKNLRFRRHILPTISLFIPQIAVQVYTLLDKTMLGSLTQNMVQVGNYEQSQKIIKTALVLVTSLGTVVSPRISSTISDGNHKQVVEYLKKSYNFVWLLGFPLMTGLMATANTVVPWFLGKEFSDSIILIMIGSALIMAIGLNNVSGIQYLISVKKQNLFTKSVVIAAIFNFCLNFILIPKFGALGAIISSVLAETLIIIVQAIDIRHDFDVRIIYKGSLKYVTGSIIMFIPVYIMGLVMSPTIITSFIQVAVGGSIYGLYLLIIKDKFTLDIIDNILSRFGGKTVCKLRKLLKR